MGQSTSTPMLSWNHEKAILSKGIDFFHNSDNEDAASTPPIIATVFDVQLPESDHNNEAQHIHTVWFRKGTEQGIHVEHVEEPPMDAIKKQIDAANAEGNSPLVMLHGYGSGAGIYYATAPSIASRWNGPVFAIDSLGCGLSSRPPHNPAIGYGKKANLEKAEDFFVDGLEQWRKTMKLDKISIIGHSLGGYISTCYTERYPENVHKLVLVGCAGVNEKPEDLEEKTASRGFLVRTINSLMTDRGWSPMSIVQYGPGKTIVGSYVDRRFADADHVPKTELANYIYNSWTGGNISTGGYSHNLFLGSMAYAKNPLENRFANLNVEKISFVYGESDWMNPKHGLKVKEELSLKPESANVDVFIVAKAGHNVMVDNPNGFVNAIMKALTSDKSTSEELTFF